MKKDLPKAYVAKDYEDAIYKAWIDAGSFQPNVKSKKKPFTITMPPPNATGTLHLGHAVMLALEDIMIRYHRMKGEPALWIPGTDHAGIATQNKVEKELLQHEKKTRHDYSREDFLQKIRDFVAGSQDTIRSQIKKMGSSCDWSREAYTMDEALAKTVYFAFEKMFRDGLIYRGDRIVNWCTRCQSTLSDDEVNYKEQQARFYYFQYGPFVIGTARPETKFGDHMVVVHPDDDRYKKYHGKKWSVPWIGDDPIIATVVADPASDPKLGSGVMTATPAHSFVDFDLAKKHGFEIIQMINEQGRLTEANGKFAGLPVSEAREKFVDILKKKGLVVKIDENYVHNLSVCYRCGTVIQPLVSKQWFIDVNHPVSTWDYKNLKLEKGRAYSLKEVSLHVLREGQIQIIPDRFNATYYQWMENLRDWCISRQIWWGHRIPVWYKKGVDRRTVSADQVKVSAKNPGPDWTQDEDTLDTWFSSGLFTFSTLGWLEKNPDFKRFHPTSVLETGYDILFFWVARMIILTTYVTGQIPFEKVYLHGLIRTRDGKKMSKSHPETCIDPLDMISEFGADALRLALFVGSSPGNDTRLYKEKIEGYRNFVNKLWNVARYILMTVDDANEDLRNDDTLSFRASLRVEKSLGIGFRRGIPPFDSKTSLSQNDPKRTPKPFTLADEWILSRLTNMVTSTTEAIEAFRFSQAAEDLYAFTWNDLADWYLEISKVQKNTGNKKIKKNADQILLYILNTLLRLWHPFTPFVTEELWKHVSSCHSDPSTALRAGRARRAEESLNPLITELWPKSEKKLNNTKAEEQFEKLRSLITAIRNLRTEHKVEPGKKIEAILISHESAKVLEDNVEVIRFLGRLEKLTIHARGKKPDQAVSSTVADIDIHLPLAGMVDFKKDQERILKEKEKLEAYVKSLESKLGNEKFVKNAPSAIVESEKKKLEVAQQSLKKLLSQFHSSLS